MFNQSKYTKTYYTIVNRAMSRPITGYVERHHIVPRSMGGSNAKSNLVPLTAKEHRLCHLLLTKMTIDPSHHRSMIFAAWRMRCNSYPGLSKGACFEYVRKEFDKINRGRKVSEETKEKLREKRKLQKNVWRGPRPEGYSSPYKGKTKENNESLKKVSEALKGREVPQIVRDKLSESAKLRPRCSCVKCHKEMTAIQSHRHFDICYAG
jgi:hypothetical protein